MVTVRIGNGSYCVSLVSDTHYTITPDRVAMQELAWELVSKTRLSIPIESGEPIVKLTTANKAVLYKVASIEGLHIEVSRMNDMDNWVIWLRMNGDVEGLDGTAQTGRYTFPVRRNLEIQPGMTETEKLADLVRLAIATVKEWKQELSETERRWRYGRQGTDENDCCKSCETDTFTDTLSERSGSPRTSRCQKGTPISKNPCEACCGFCTSLKTHSTSRRYIKTKLKRGPQVYPSVCVGNWMFKVTHTEDNTYAIRLDRASFAFLTNYMIGKTVVTMDKNLAANRTVREVAEGYALVGVLREVKDMNLLVTYTNDVDKWVVWGQVDGTLVSDGDVHEGSYYFPVCCGLQLPKTLEDMVDAAVAGILRFGYAGQLERGLVD